MLIKVCGLTRNEDICLCEGLPVDLVGFIFHPGSPRQVDPAWVGRITTRCRKVGVVTTPDLQLVAQLAATARVDMLQLHGDYPLEASQILGPERTIAVLWPERYATAQDFQRAVARWKDGCAFVLLDAGTRGGGHGRTVRLPWPMPSLPMPWILAGGLGPSTIQGALALQPDGLDLNSGVETAPGHKDATKLHATLKRIRGTS